MFGGVNSLVCVFKFVGMNLLFMECGKGFKVYDIDGNEYIDYVLLWGFLIYGYVNDCVVEVLKFVVERGISFGVLIEIENKLVKFVIECVLLIEIVCMVNFGMEVIMSVLCLVCGYIGCNKILKFIGCYYGYGDLLLIKVGFGVVILGLLDSFGVLEGVVKNMIIVVYNDLESVKYVFE